MEQKKKIIVAVAAVLVLMVGLMAWKKSETKLSGRYKTDQSTQYIYMLPEEFVFENGYCDIGSFTCTYEYKNGTLYFIGVMRYGRASNAQSMEIKL